MDWKTFFSNIITTVAWPSVALVFIILTRNKFDKLLEIFSRLQKAKFPGVEVEFSEALEKARDASEFIAIEQSPTNIPEKEAISLPQPNDLYLKLAQDFPEAAIMTAFQEVEQAIIEHKDKFPDIKGYNLGAFVTQLARAELLSPEIVDQFKRVRNLRNIAAHSKGPNNISAGEALEYRAICRSLAEIFHAAFLKVGDQPSVA